ncbi:UDP binding domain-containing protein [Streptomyces lydicus]|uniref:UDP binding domain-containing protein n=1 Tax=Streptomyces lydicus TaxID=47763 RepID=UPI0037B5D31E
MPRVARLGAPWSVTATAVVRPAAGEPWDSVTRFPTVQQALADADAAVIVTEWPELAELDWTEAHSAMRTPVIFDGRNLLDPDHLREIGFRYTSVGHP